MGSPGSGKTTVGRILGQRLGMPVLDVDDHHLESYWGKSVAEKLAEVGSSNFIEAEGKATLDFTAEGSVISLTGSNPMYPPAMAHIAKLGIVVFLDAYSKDIVERLERMKVNRIVGQEDGTSMADILVYRQQFYESAYDLRILMEAGETPESVTSKVEEALKIYWKYDGYTSTRAKNKSKEGRKSFSSVILEGLAPDGGLYVPEKAIPKLSLGQLERLVPLDYPFRALRILEKWVHPKDLHPSRLRAFVEAAYNKDNFSCDEIFPVKHLTDNQFLIELFHGPTASFKDAALQLMPQFFLEAMIQEGSSQSPRYLILVATSGDTGGAVLDGFTRFIDGSKLKVMVFYPEQGISDIQKRQMTSIEGDNCSVIGVRGDFDVCQAFVKRAFKDQDLADSILATKHYKLSAANSINWGRLLPQVVYHVSGYLDLVKERHIAMGDEVDLCIPTGNFGNILAAYYAKEMGIPFKRLICASNTNNVLTEFINTGMYDLRNRKLHLTASPAIDILVSSNLERFLYHVSGHSAHIVSQCYNNLEKDGYFRFTHEALDHIQTIFFADWCSEEQCREAVQRTYKQTGYILDPHTAVGKVVADRFNQGHRPMIIASTAHYGKFGPDVAKFLDHQIKETSLSGVLSGLSDLSGVPAMHASLLRSTSLPRLHSHVIDASYSQCVEEIHKFL